MMNLVLIVERRAPNEKRAIPVTWAVLTNQPCYPWLRHTDKTYGTLAEAVRQIKQGNRYWLEGRNYE